MSARIAIGLSAAPGPGVTIGGFPMGAHNSSPGCDAFIEHFLHDFSLIQVLDQSHAVTLPVRTCPCRLRRQNQSGNILQKRLISLSHMTTLVDRLGESLQLFSSDCGLDIRQPVIESEFRIRLKHNRWRRMSSSIRQTHPVLSPKAKPFIDRAIRRGEHSSVARGEQLSGMKRKTCDSSMRLANLLPSPSPKDLASNGACRVFDDGDVVLVGDLEYFREIARHSHLVNT